jgi:CMP-N,N'-diacetyllegionaminic acid synthase
MRTLAIIPARGGSKRLPGKNTRMLCGRPLICWTIGFAQSIPWFDHVHVSTDSADIAHVAASAGAQTERLRPPDLATDEASSVAVALDVLKWFQTLGRSFELVALLQPTTPVRRLNRWNEARDLIDADACDAVVGIRPVETHPYLTYRVDAAGCIEPFCQEAAVIKRSQDFPDAYAVNGAMYLVRADILMREQSFFPNRTGAILCDNDVENIDIDTQADWFAAERLIAGEMRS